MGVRLICPVANDGEPPKSIDAHYPREWWEASGFGWQTVSIYIARRKSLHTGADLNRLDGKERGKAVYAAADGVVTCARALRGWAGGEVVVIHHAHLDLCTRYAHVKALVTEGQQVKAGDKIAEIADYPPSGWIGDHLHFDVAKGDLLVREPGHWCGMSARCVEQHYVEPLKALRTEWAVKGDAEQV